MLTINIPTNNAKRTTSIITLVLCLFVSSISFASDDSVKPKPVDLLTEGVRYVPAVITNKPEFNYPTSARFSKQEAHIQMTYDINKQGRAVNLKFVRSSGTELFEKVLARNIENWHIQAATLNGEAITQKANLQEFSYGLKKQNGKLLDSKMRVQFQRLYKQLKTLLKAQEYARFEKLHNLLQQANIANFTENRQLWLIKHSFLLKTNGNTEDKIIALERALRGKAKTQKAKKLFAKIKETLFEYYQSENYFAKAHEVYQDIANSPFGQESSERLLAKAQANLSKLSTSKTLHSPIMFNDTGIISHPLYKQRFSVNTQSPIEFGELRCEDFNVKLDLKANTQYKYPDTWGKCSLILQAEPGAQAKVYEV